MNKAKPSKNIHALCYTRLTATDFAQPQPNFLKRIIASVRTR